MSETLAARRRRALGDHVPTFYETPLHLVRGEGVWLWDAAGRRYLDAYNNVPHVGHCHPHVTEAIARQAATLNTHTRYLHDSIVAYVERLTARLDHGLSQMLFTCTGSEANDVALRMAQAATGRTGLIATDNTYHGNTTATAQLSTRRPPIGGYPSHVRLVPAPDSLHPVGGSRAGQAEAFAAHVAQAAAELDAAGHGVSAMVICPAFANEGLPTLPPGFFAPAEAALRAAGGLVICDEVQPGFGRLGTAFWGHTRIGVAPDIVTLGKPMGNGHPVAGLVTRPELMGAFRRAFGYFNTFGGNPVSMAAAHAMLDVLEGEGLQENARRSGAHALRRLAALDDARIAEVRGQGLFFGVVLEAEDGSPATALAADVVEGMRRHGVLAGRIGRHTNIIKMRPPMPFSTDHADRAVAALRAALREAAA